MQTVFNDEIFQSAALHTEIRCSMANSGRFTLLHDGRVESCRASRVLISTCSAPLVQTGERKQTHTA